MAPSARRDITEGLRRESRYFLFDCADYCLCFDYSDCERAQDNSDASVLR